MAAVVAHQGERNAVFPGGPDGNHLPFLSPFLVKSGLGFRGAQPFQFRGGSERRPGGFDEQGAPFTTGALHHYGVRAARLAGKGEPGGEHGIVQAVGEGGFAEHGRLGRGVQGGAHQRREGENQWRLRGEGIVISAGFLQQQPDPQSHAANVVLQHGRFYRHLAAGAVGQVNQAIGGVVAVHGQPPTEALNRIR